MQAISNPEKNQLMVKLADKMSQKLVNDGGITTFEAVRLHLEILNAQGKFSDAATCLGGELGKMCKVSQERLRLSIDYLEKDNQWALVKKSCFEMFALNADDWVTHVSFVKSFAKSEETMSETM